VATVKPGALPVGAQHFLASIGVEPEPADEHVDRRKVVRRWSDRSLLEVGEQEASPVAHNVVG